VLLVRGDGRDERPLLVVFLDTHPKVGPRFRTPDREQSCCRDGLAFIALFRTPGSARAAGSLRFVAERVWALDQSAWLTSGGVRVVGSFGVVLG